MTVTRELSTADDYAADHKQQQKLQKQQQSEAAEEPNPAMSSAAPAATSVASSNAPSTSPSTTVQSSASRPKFMITDILRNDSPASVNNINAHYPPPHQQAPMQPQHHPFYQFNLAAAAAAAAAYGFNPAAVMPGMMPPLHQLLVGHHHQQHHPQMPMMMPSNMVANSAESSPRDLSFKRSAAAANFANDPVDDEDEFVDPDGSDHDRDSPIGKVDLMLSDDESDICKFLPNKYRLLDCEKLFQSKGMCLSHRPSAHSDRLIIRDRFD